MAVLLNIISSGSRKSAGAATFRRVRGRTIMSQKRGASTKAAETRAAAGLVRTYREAMFFIVAAFADGMQNSINESFEPTKYGSRRNAFFKLNYSPIELAVNGSTLGLALIDQLMHEVSFTGVSVEIAETNYAIQDFSSNSLSQLFMAAISSGVNGVYVRSTIGGTTFRGFDETWQDASDPGTASVTSIQVMTSTGDIVGQAIQEVSIFGTNLPSPIPYAIRVGNPQAEALLGTWSGNTFTTSGASATKRYSGTYTVYITNADRVLFSRNVVFYGIGAGGE